MTDRPTHRTRPTPAPSRDPAEEQRHLATVEKSLVEEFGTQLSAGEVTRHFALIVHDFDGAPIRDFVPVLVAKRARQELRRARTA